MMKKLVAIMMVITLMVAFTGCEKDEKVSSMLAKNAYESENKLKKLMAENPDDLFWESASRARQLIEKTVEKHKSFSISFRVETEHGEKYLLEDVYASNLTYINDVWRNYLSSEVIQALAKTKPVVNAHKNGETLEITGIIMKWEQKPAKAKLFDSEQRVYSVCDLSGNGSWDFVTEGRIYFTEETNAVSLKDEDGKHLGIDEVEIRRTKLVEMEGEDDLTFDGLAEIAFEEG